jgi:hypothetical protein
MRDTFYVGYDPAIKLWEVTPITHSFDAGMWVFRVAARNEHEAMLAGLDQYKGLTAPLTPEQQRLFGHVSNQVGKLSRVLHESMIIEIPDDLMAHAKEAAEKGFFTVAGADEVILNTSTAGWKAIQAHQIQAPAKRREHDSEFSFG